MEILNQAAITKDAVHAEIDAVLYYQVQDSYKASYSIDNHEFAIHQIVNQIINTKHKHKHKQLTNTNRL